MEVGPPPIGSRGPGDPPTTAGPIGGGAQLKVSNRVKAPQKTPGHSHRYLRDQRALDVEAYIM